MHSFEETLSKVKLQYPNLEIRFKNESLLMKILGVILFFNKDFIQKYITTIGSTVYFPSKEYLDKHNVSCVVELLHELVHIRDANKNRLWFTFSYLFPQIFFILSIPFAIFIDFKFSLFFLLFLLPIPSYFRMVSERRAYTISLYVVTKLKNKDPLIDINEFRNTYVKQFKNLSYYLMWPFSNVDEYFDDVILQFSKNKKPSDMEPEIFDFIDSIF